MARDSRAGPSRRRVLAAAAGVVGGALAPGLLALPATAADGPDLSAWFEDTDDATGVVDRRGRSRVEVAVGAAGNGGAFAFDPAVVRIDPGTTVVWTWTGKGGMHNVVAADGSFESPFHSAAGDTFEFVPDAPGVVRYACAPHEAMGMKGALVVGDGAVSLGSAAGAATPTTTSTPSTTPESPPARTFDGWLADTDNYDGVVDRRGESTVTVKVGADGNGGAFAFDPAAVHVDPGTDVVWEWVGDKRYDVADPELGYHSDLVAGSGHRFAVSFGGDGLSTYACTAYGEKGMRGVVLVGDGPVTVLSPTGLVAVGAGGTVASLPMLYGLREHVRDATPYVGSGRPEERHEPPDRP